VPTDSSVMRPSTGSRSVSRARPRLSMGSHPDGASTSRPLASSVYTAPPCASSWRGIHRATSAPRRTLRRMRRSFFMARTPRWSRTSRRAALEKKDCEPRPLRPPGLRNHRTRERATVPPPSNAPRQVPVPERAARAAGAASRESREQSRGRVFARTAGVRVASGSRRTATGPRGGAHSIGSSVTSVVPPSTTTIGPGPRSRWAETWYSPAATPSMTSSSPVTS